MRRCIDAWGLTGLARLDVAQLLTQLSQRARVGGAGPGVGATEAGWRDGRVGGR